MNGPWTSLVALRALRRCQLQDQETGQSTVLAYSGPGQHPQAILVWQLREHYRRRDPATAGLIVDYRKKFLDSFVRGGDEEAQQAHLTPALSPSDAER